MLRKKIEKADRLEMKTIQECIDESHSVGSNDNGDDSFSIAHCSSSEIEAKGKSTWKELVDLFEENMGELYRKSSWGLNLEDKSKELQHRKARYFIVRDKQKDNGLVAYCHYRFCLDDDEQPTCAVLYVFELQVASKYRRQGWGRKLMNMAERLAKAADMPKVALTTFKKNKAALTFYRESLQYDIDPDSPSQYNEPADYEILSKVVG